MTPTLRHLFTAAALTVAMAASATAQTTIVGFDDLPVNTSFDNPMPTGYGGIDWQGADWYYLTCGVVFNCPTPGPDPYPYTPHSFPGMATVGYDVNGTNLQQFGFVGGPKVFNGAWVTTFDNDIFGYVLMLNGNVVHTTPIMTSNAAPSFAASGYSGPVDQVIIVSSDIGDWAIDDLSYTALPVPEPGTLPMMASALAVFGALLHRRRRRGA
jgi:hypothetical protein